MNTTETINVGDIWYDSWGYDQTNVGFYMVIAKTKAMVTCAKVQSEWVETDSWASGKVVPTKEIIGKPFKKRVMMYCNKPTFKSPWHGYCYPYEDQPVFTSHWA